MTRDNRDDGPGVRIPPPLLYLAVLALGILLGVAYPVHFLPTAVAWPIGALILAAGVALGPLWGIRTMLSANTTVRPDRPATTLVTDGPFRYSRNPLYLSLTLMYAGIGIIANSLWALILLPAVVLFMSLFVIRREEAHLQRAFGEEYERYRANVRRWL
ncbi:MAG: isoprenylcysteine carboxylmethyltransferase family protein [Methylobacteriaceae bacterium]|nr:isoprenylcysteine carboxylmethyltransferase family protein [Methylobacteriaceae bacterium]